jgi:hemoglobin
MLDDLKNREDIELLINTFYEKIVADELLGPIFNEIAKVDWSHHLPKMYDFWNMALFDAPGYLGHPITPHLALNQQIKIKSEHFEAWLRLFNFAVDELFMGSKADEIKERAKEIGISWAYKFEYLNK